MGQRLGVSCLTVFFTQIEVNQRSMGPGGFDPEDELDLINLFLPGQS